MKTIYISGKIAGCDPLEVRRKFFRAWQRVGGFVMHDGNGYAYLPDVLNPVTIAPIPNGTWQDYIERDLIYLKHCDAIYMLKNWKDSAGARVEHEFAKKLGLEIIYEENE